MLDRQSRRLEEADGGSGRGVQGVLRRTAGRSAAHGRLRAVRPDRGRVSGAAGRLPPDAGSPPAGAGRLPSMPTASCSSRVMDNLVSNICKYALEDTRVYAVAACDEEHVTISFKNVSRAELNISPDELMERFVRGDASRHTQRAAAWACP